MWRQMQERGDPRWMTYKQAQSIGAQVRKGERGTPVQYWKFSARAAVKDERGKRRKRTELPPTEQAAMYEVELLTGSKPSARVESAKLADRLIRDHGLVPVFTGVPSEEHLVKEVLGSMEERDRAVDLSGKMGLKPLTALLDRSAFVLSNDTGPVHIASALGKPVPEVGIETSGLRIQHDLAHLDPVLVQAVDGLTCEQVDTLVF